MSFAGLLNTTCTLLRRTSGTDDYGQPIDTYASNGTAKCRISPQSAKEIRVGKEMIISTHKIFLPTGTDITTEDRITEGSNTYNIIEVADAAGHGHHIEVQAVLV